MVLPVALDEEQEQGIVGTHEDKGQTDRRGSRFRVSHVPVQSKAISASVLFV